MHNAYEILVLYVRRQNCISFLPSFVAIIILNIVQTYNPCNIHSTSAKTNTTMEQPKTAGGNSSSSTAKWQIRTLAFAVLAIISFQRISHHSDNFTQQQAASLFLEEEVRLNCRQQQDDYSSNASSVKALQMLEHELDEYKKASEEARTKIQALEKTIAQQTRAIKNDRQTVQQDLRKYNQTEIRVAAPVAAAEDTKTSVRPKGAGAVKNSTIVGTVEPRHDHPHAGARYADGSWGYIADVTRIRKRMLSRFQTDDNNNKANNLRSYLPVSSSGELFQVCNSLGKYNESELVWTLTNQVLTRMVTKDPVFDSTHDSDASSRVTTARKEGHKTRILCATYTHAGAHDRIRGIAETWGWRCDGYFAASTRTVEDPDDDGFGAIDLPHYGPEQYNNMWQKTRSIVAYMYDHYLEDFDYFYVAGDDTHLIVENLRYQLDKIETDHQRQQHHPNNGTLYLGNWIRAGGFDFAHGGPGYVLNRNTLKFLVEQILPKCEVQTQVSSEDRMMGKCLHLVGKIPPSWNSSVDETGAQLFHFSNPMAMVKFNISRAGPRDYMRRCMERWTQLYGFRQGLDFISNRSIAFHHFKPTEHMKRQHAILYKSCPEGTLIGDLLDYGDGGSIVISNS